MPKLPILSAKDILKILTKSGFYYSRQKGSHIVMVKFVNDKKIIVIVPNHKEIDPGYSIINYRTIQDDKRGFSQQVVV